MKQHRYKIQSGEASATLTKKQDTKDTRCEMVEPNNINRDTRYEMVAPKEH